MTLVAQGAALYAATAQLSARPTAAAPVAAGPRVWLQFPAMTPDLAPFVVGKVLDGGAEALRVVLQREDGAWSSEPEALDAEGAFALQVNLAPRRPNVFRVGALSATGASVPLQPPSFTIVHGVTLSDPPLSRSIGVALANDRVQIFLERGSPLPMQRTFVLHTVEAIIHGVEGFALRLPIVQGEFPLAHLCRLVGALEIPSQDVKATLPAGSRIELTLSLDRGGHLSATARVPALEQSFDEVAHLVAPHVPAGELAERAKALRARSSALVADAVRQGVGAKVIAKLGELEPSFAELDREIERARGDDPDAAEKARRVLLELDATLADADAELAWPKLEATVRSEIAWAVSWCGQYATPDERTVLHETIAALDKARVARDVGEVDRQLAIVTRLGCASYYRLPDAWQQQFEHAASRVTDATDLPRATRLVRDGWAAVAKGDRAALETIVRALWQLLPADPADRRLGYSSGVR